MKKKAQVHMLPTISSKLVMSNTNKLWINPDISVQSGLAHPQHLYFTSDEEIKEPCWAINKNGDTLYHITDVTLPHWDEITKHWNKVVATTNPELWYTRELTSKGEFEQGLLYKANSPYPRYEDALGMKWFKPSGIAHIGDDFVEAYIKAYNEGKPITEVNLEYIYQCDNGHFMSYQGACTYPHCHSSNELKINLRSNGTVIISPVVKKTYDRDEVTTCIDEYLRHFITTNELTPIDEWFDKHYPQ
jgi:hypothetical protein